MIVSKKKKGKTLPLKSILVDAMALMRRKNSKTSSNSKQTPKFILGAAEMVKLGKLIHHWKEVVGPELSTKVWPERLFRSKLSLIVKNNQWLNTLTFCKEQILENIKNVFPELGILKIIGRVGKLPDIKKLNVFETVVEWPDWHNEADKDFADISDVELLKTMQVCRKKLGARVKGLLKTGYFMCPKCSANMVYAKEKICAVCLYKQRIKELSIVRNTLSDYPWMNYFEMQNMDKKLTTVEFDSIKSFLLQDSMYFIEQLGQQLTDEIDKKLNSELRFEIVRAIVLITGASPNKIDLDKLDSKYIMAETWYKYIQMSKPEEKEKDSVNPHR